MVPKCSQIQAGLQPAKHFFAIGAAWLVSQLKAYLQFNQERGKE